MSGYSLEDEHGIPYYTYHADRTVCDADACTCALPTSAQVYAQRTAEGRADWYVSLPGAHGVQGPLSHSQARELTDEAVKAGRKPKLLRVVEDYT